MRDQIQILVTGANGFIGAAVCKTLLDSAAVRGVVRTSSLAGGLPESVEIVHGELSETFDWSGSLDGIDAVVHCAARVHVTHESAADPLSEFRAVNVDGTMALARQAAKAGVRRFVFISSIGVNGGETFDKPYSANDTAQPHTQYAVSKYEAELGLRQLATESGMEIVIIRPPLVYGANAPGNFAMLQKLLKSGVPLPLAALAKNRRSFVYLGNLIDLVVVCLNHPAAANETFLVSDGEDISTVGLLRRLGSAMGKPVRLIYVPVRWLGLGARLLGKGGMFQSLSGSLQVDIGKAYALLGWKPPISVDDGLRRAVQGLGK